MIRVMIKQIKYNMCLVDRFKNAKGIEIENYTPERKREISMSF